MRCKRGDFYSIFRNYNMKEKIEPVFEIVEIAKVAMESLDLKPLIKPIRGGTDGSQLSYMGLPARG
jgi:tripeptide aminopeptidase